MNPTFSQMYSGFAALRQEIAAKTAASTTKNSKNNNINNTGNENTQRLQATQVPHYKTQSHQEKDVEEEKVIHPRKAAQSMQPPPPTKSLLSGRSEGPAKNSYNTAMITEPVSFDQPISSVLTKRRRDNPDGWVHTPGHQGNPGVVLNEKYTHILQPHFVFYLVGKPGSGKTFILEELLINTDLYGGRFDEILIFSPYKMPTLKTVEGVNWWTSLRPIEKLAEKINRISDANPKANICIVIDDRIAELDELSNDGYIRDLFYNRRKTIPSGTISFLITGQKYKVFPHTFRPVLTGVFAFGRIQGNEWSHIVSECAYLDNLKAANVVVSSHLKKQHNFVFFNLLTGDTWLNFRQKLS